MLEKYAKNRVSVSMKIINQALLDSLQNEARKDSRERKNYNFHDDLSAPAQRLLNALEPGTSIPVHRHPHTAETYVVLRGEIEVQLFNDAGMITESATLSPSTGNYGIHILAGTWHGLKVLKSAVIFEVKDGPYTPVTSENILHSL